MQTFQAPEEIDAILTAANAAFRKAIDDAHAALNNARREASRVMHARALLSTDPNGTLATYAAQSRATWSGGPLGGNNVEETIIRDAALDLLSREQWRKPLRANAPSIPGNMTFERVKS